MSKQNNHNKKPQKASQDDIVLDFENPPPIPEVGAPPKKSKKNPKSLSKIKEEPVNNIQEEPKPEPQPEPETVKRKRNPPNFKLKIAIIEHLREKNVEDTMIQQIKGLFGLGATS